MTALLALALCLWSAVRLSGQWSPRSGSGIERWLAAAVLLPTLGISVTRVLAGIGWLRPWEILSCLGGLACLAEWTSRGTPSSPRASPSAIRPVDALALALGALGLGLAMVAAVGLPIWQWDSLGYHLPFVAYALQSGSLAGVPDLPYLGSYPHAVELWDLGARALLADDHWLGTAQLPLCVCGAIGIAGLARRAGALTGTAAVVGALWLCLPAVFLQLPTAYVDVVSASFFLLATFWILASPSPRSAVLLGLALGLFLGSKPSAPAAVLLLLLAFAVRAWVAKQWLSPLFTAGLASALGAESYVVNVLRHANPLWPIRLDLGPIHLPGSVALREVLASGAAAPHLTGSLPGRVVAAWTSLGSSAIYDMRVGGFGPLFLFFALPLGLIAIVRLRGAWAVAALAALTTADPAIARFTFPFPGILLALAGAEVDRWRPSWRTAAIGVATALASVGLWLALPGLSGGIPLREALGLSLIEQQAALLPAKNADRWAALRASIGPGTRIGVDRLFDLSYLLWRSDLANQVELVPDDLDGSSLSSWLDARGIEILVVGGSSAGHQAARRPDRWVPLFPCGASEPACVVYVSAPLAPIWQRRVSRPVQVPARVPPEATDRTP